jgi:hypothetical protein
VRLTNKMQIKCRTLLVFVFLLLTVGCSSSHEKTSPVFILKNLNENPFKVKIQRDYGCKLKVLEPSQTIELGEAFFLQNIFIKFANEKYIYSYDTSTLLPFYHWSFIYDWKVFLGIDHTKNIYLLKDDLTLNLENQPINGDFPIEFTINDKAVINCDK